MDEEHEVLFHFINSTSFICFAFWRSIAETRSVSPLLPFENWSFDTLFPVMRYSSYVSLVVVHAITIGVALL
jgi:hypothetical protein